MVGTIAAAITTIASHILDKRTYKNNLPWISDKQLKKDREERFVTTVLIGPVLIGLTFCAIGLHHSKTVTEPKKQALHAAIKKALINDDGAYPLKIGAYPFKKDGHRNFMITHIKETTEWTKNKRPQTSCEIRAESGFYNQTPFGKRFVPIHTTIKRQGPCL